MEIFFRTAVEVALRAPYTLINSEFNPFLFAPIGEESNGMMLSVISALARLEIDPWEEAARLAGLPKEAAATALDHLIERLPRGLWARSDIPAIAASLIELLPRGARAAPSDQAEAAGGGKRGVPTIAWLMVLTLVATVFFNMAIDRGPHTGGAGDAANLRSSTISPSTQR